MCYCKKALLLLCPIIGLSIEEFFVLPHSLLRLNCPRARLAAAVVAQFLKREMEFSFSSHHDNRPFHFRRISIQSRVLLLFPFLAHEGLTCHLKKVLWKENHLTSSTEKKLFLNCWKAPSFFLVPIILLIYSDQMRKISRHKLGDSAVFPSHLFGSRQSPCQLEVSRRQISSNYIETSGALEIGSPYTANLLGKKRGTIKTCLFFGVGDHATSYYLIRVWQEKLGYKSCSGGVLSKSNGHLKRVPKFLGLE